MEWLESRRSWLVGIGAPSIGGAFVTEGILAIAFGGLATFAVLGFVYTFPKIKKILDWRIAGGRFVPLEDYRSWNLRKTKRPGWRASMVQMQNLPQHSSAVERVLGLSWIQEDHSTELTDASCTVQRIGDAPSTDTHPGPGPKFGNRQLNRFHTYYPVDFPNVEQRWPVAPGEYAVTWLEKRTGQEMASYDFRVTATGQVLVRVGRVGRRSRFQRPR